MDDSLSPRMGTEQRPSQGEAAFRTLVENGNDLFARYDLALRYQYVSPHIRRFVDARPEALLGKTHREAGFPDALADLLDGALREAIAQKKGRKVAYEATDREGREVFLESRFYPELDGSGGVESVLGVSRDVTASHRAEHELARRVQERTQELAAANLELQRQVTARATLEREFEMLFEVNPDLLCTAGVDGHFKRVNPAFVSTLGYTAEELCARPYVEFVHPDDRAFTIEDGSRAFSAQGMRDFENRYIAKDGTVVWLSWSARPSATDPTLTYGIARNISKRKRALAALRRSEEQYRQLVETLPDALYTYSATRAGTYYSPQVEQLLGYAPEHLLAHPKLWHDSIHPDDLPAVDRAIGANPAGSRVELEYRIRDALGRWRWFLDRFVDVVDERGDKVIHGLARDVTEKRALQERLQRLLREQSVILDNANVGISLMVERRQVWVNRKMEEMFQYSKGEMEGSTTRMLYPSEEAYQRAGEDAYTVLASGNAYQCEQWLLRRDGTKVCVRYNGRAVEPPDMSKGTIWIFDDITENKTAEDQLKAALAEKEVLLKEVHHRVKNNMAVISSLLRLQTRGVQEPRVREVLLDAQGRVSAMAMVHESLYQSKSLSRVDLGRFLGRIVRNLQLTYGGAGRPAVSVAVDGGGIQVDVDQATPLGLVVNEIVTNSLKYAFPDDRPGAITVVVRRVDARIEVRVADDGVGLPAGMRWCEVHTLGLDLVKRLVENQLLGTVELEPGPGSCFCVTFSGEPLRAKSG